MVPHRPSQTSPSAARLPRSQHHTAVLLCTTATLWSYDSKKLFYLIIEYYAKLEDLVEQHNRCVAHNGPQRDGQERNELDKGN